MIWKNFYFLTKDGNLVSGIRRLLLVTISNMVNKDSFAEIPSSSNMQMKL